MLIVAYPQLMASAHVVSFTLLAVVLRITWWIQDDFRDIVQLSCYYVKEVTAVLIVHSPGLPANSFILPNFSPRTQDLSV